MKPYTRIGIKRLKCFRCGAQAVHQWNICSDGGQYRPMCLECDIELNRFVLKWAGFPDHEALGNAYELKARIENA